MPSYLEIVSRDKELQARLFDSAMETRRFFEAQGGYRIETGTRADTFPLQKGLLEACCGDDRYANHGGNKLSWGKAGRVSLIGGLYLVMAEIAGGHPGGVKYAYDYAKDRGIILTNHGDMEHGGLGCGMFNMWVSRKLNTKYFPQFGSDVIISTARQEKIVYHALPGPHLVQMISLNFLPFTAVKRTPESITHDVAISDALNIKNVNSLVFSLSQELNIKTIQIIS